MPDVVLHMLRPFAFPAQPVATPWPSDKGLTTCVLRL